MTCRALPACLVAALSLAAGAVSADDIVRCKASDGRVTYQVAPCPDRSDESRPRIATSYPAPNTAETQRIFQREAELDKRLEARRDRELVEQQMREARAEREAERERLALLAAAQQQQYGIAYFPYGARPGRAGRPVARHYGHPIWR
jgi:hypothetical protein